MYNVYIKNARTGEKRITETAPDAYSADRIAARTGRQIDADHIAYIEPAQGWDAEAKRAEAIEASWAAWRRAHGFAQEARA